MPKVLAGDRLHFLGSFTDRLPPSDLPEIAFAGRSNVGKSSCLNTLVGVHGAARVSRQPGRTQAINLFEVEHRYILADLPGYGFAKVPREIQRAWRDALGAYLAERDNLKGVVVLLDPRRALDPLDDMLFEALDTLDLPILIVATKTDKLTRNELVTALARLGKTLGVEPGTILPFSSHTRAGLEELRANIEDIVGPTPGTR